MRSACSSGPLRDRGGGWHWILLPLALFVQAALGAQEPLCLDDAIPPESRKSVLIDGVQQPVGIWCLQWQSATFNFDILKLITEEVLGYQTLETGRSAIVVSGLWAITGCRVPVTLESEAREQCNLTDDTVSTTHLTVETWDFYLPTTLSELERGFPNRQPINLGGLGFSGLAANWVPKEIFLEGQRDGIMLDHYRSYNDSMFFPAKYFDSIEDINTTQFFQTASRCKDYPPMNQDKEVRNYFKHFKDYDGIVNVTIDGETKMHGRCDDGVWWLSPACRANRTRCIPWITVLGYGYTIIWHKIIEFNLPIAMASTNNWTAVIHDTRVLNYAWVPDAQFVNRGLMQVMFPGYNQDEHDKELFISEFAEVVTEKWAHRGLRETAPRLWAAVQNMSIPRNKMQEYLELMVRQSLTSRQAACRFLRENQELWRPWILNESSCTEGWGLAPGTSYCEYCPAGTESVPHSTIRGSRECRLCEPGYFQTASRAISCDPCPKGTANTSYGAEACPMCEQGKFASATGQSVCEPCPAFHTTLVEGATLMTQCICEEGYYQPEGAIYTCRQCPEELDCSQKGTSMSATTIDGTPPPRPRVKEGYYAESDDPEKIYKCRNTLECPGGSFGTCGPHRGIDPDQRDDSTGLVCAKCVEQYYQTFNGDCFKCGPFELGYFLVPGVQLLLAPIVCVGLYAMLKDPFTSEIVDAPPRKLSLLASIVLVQVQTLGIIKSMSLNLPEAALQGWEVGNAVNSPLTVFKAECAGGGSMGNFQVQYIMRSLQPLGVCLFFFLTYCTSRIISRALGGEPENYDGPKFSLRYAFQIGMKGPQTFNAAASVLFTFCIAVFQLAFELFQCYSHPQGDMHSMQGAPEVACNSPLWQTLVGVGVTAVILYGVVPQAVFCYVLYHGPSYFHGRRFRSTWKFLIVKWKPSVWWWSLPFLAKGFFLSLTNVIFEAANFQVLWVTSIQLIYFFALMLFTPWRHIEGQRADAVVTGFMVAATMCCFVWAEPKSPDENETFANIAVPFCFLPMAYILGLILMLIRASVKFVLGDHNPALLQGIADSFKLSKQIQVLAGATLLDLMQATVHSTPADRYQLKRALSNFISEVMLTQRASGIANLSKTTVDRLVQRRASPWLKEQLQKTGNGITSADRDFKERVQMHISEDALFGDNEEVSAEAFAEAWCREGGEMSANYAVDLLDPYGNGKICKAAYIMIQEHLWDFISTRSPRSVMSSTHTSVMSPSLSDGAFASPSMPRTSHAPREASNSTGQEMHFISVSV